MRRLFLALLLLLTAAPATAKINAGRLVDLGTVRSRYADSRRVTVWLPSGYTPIGLWRDGMEAG
jgi:hypothetical protein